MDHTKPRNKKTALTSCVSLILDEKEIPIYFGVVARAVARDKVSLCSFPAICQITRKKKSIGIPHPPRSPSWDGEEMKALQMTGKRQLNVSRHNSSPFLALSLSLWRPKRFIYSSSEQNLSPLVTENWIGQPNAEMHVAHTIWVHSFLCTPAQSPKTQS